MSVIDVTWIEDLPDAMAGQRMLLRGLLSFCEAGESIRWLAIGCSVSRGASDYLSDLDVAIGVRDDDFAAAIPEIHLAVDGPGELVDSYSASSSPQSTGQPCPPLWPGT
jgi:hypothetical protein